MKFKTLTGKIKDVQIKPYLIDWDGDQLSKFQEEVVDFVYPFWKDKIVLSEFPVAGTKMRFDIVNLSDKIVIEVNGIAHLSPKSHFHGGSPASYIAQMKRDMQKSKWCDINGFQLIEIEPDDMPLTREFIWEKYKILL